MTDLPQTALAFAREIMGWDDAYYHEGSCIQRSVLRTSFYYTDLNSVMDAAAKWCNENQATFGIHFDGESYEANVVINCGKFLVCGDIDEYSANKNPCQAIMQACLEANMQMKEKAA